MQHNDTHVVYLDIMLTDLKKYLGLYTKTAKDIIISVKENLKTLQNDAQNHKTIEEIHRNFHSLKSQSLVMGFTNTGTVCRLLEQILLSVVEKKRAVDTRLVKQIDQFVKSIEESINSIEDNGTETNLSEDVKILKDMI